MYMYKFKYKYEYTYQHKYKYKYKFKYKYKYNSSYCIPWYSHCGWFLTHPSKWNASFYPGIINPQALGSEVQKPRRNQGWIYEAMENDPFIDDENDVPVRTGDFPICKAFKYRR